MDKKLEKLLKKEVEYQSEILDLIASENMASRETLAVLSSPLSNKYSEGYPGKRYYPGNKQADKVELLTQERALKLFGIDKGGWQVNVQPYSGSPANLAVYLALVEPRGVVMGMRLADGGHLTHGHNVSATGKIWKTVQYGVDKETGLINYSEVAKLAKKYKPKLIISGFTAYPRKVDFKKFRAIADSVGAYHMADISHIAGLVAGGVHPSPFPWADVVTTTTHKSLRGPRGAMIFSNGNSKIAKRNEVNLPLAINKAVFPGLQGGPHNNVTAAKAQAFSEALKPEFKNYVKQIVKNAKALSKGLQKRGFNLVSGGTDTHLILIDVTNFSIGGMEAEKKLEAVNIIANRNSVPGDPSPFEPSGVRMGTPSLTSRGMKEAEMDKVAELIYKAISGEKSVKQEVIKLCRKFPARKFLGK
ncbi:MAG: serine hydroxymethyltransferase [Candidatus Colwellbacteria bacterium CG10_big_fil_rev_8_21_14_0_10_42_22]|uniref:Serine hydroxymethyltransferase n=1 Tax=Candidatus Colwellbacteria bacterium CG10_big_fil_rev_8_21_14_0_10_42_22 TaxID=1974540 RepID=A0A2H0VGR7_9BACT|nr:MAG: serine hydroxymethyltransferase [Candidatus Colwellbacteria bacterium CG10_big_fil_rev_8_21_14_0_10_42_22]